MKPSLQTRHTIHIPRWIEAMHSFKLQLALTMDNNLTTRDFGTQSIHPSIVLCPFWNWGAVCVPFNAQHRTSVLQVSTKQGTFFDILHTFKPCLYRPSSLSGARNHQVCDGFDWGRMARWTYPLSEPSKLLAANDCHNILNSKFLK